jgi:hypothetical protein
MDPSRDKNRQASNEQIVDRRSLADLSPNLELITFSSSSSHKIAIPGSRFHLSIVGNSDATLNRSRSESRPGEPVGFR